LLAFRAAQRNGRLVLWEWYGVTLNPEEEILGFAGRDPRRVLRICITTYINPAISALIPPTRYHHPTHQSAAKLAGARLLQGTQWKRMTGSGFAAGWRKLSKSGLLARQTS